MDDPKIKKVTPMEGYRLRVELQNGSVLELCMGSLLQTIRFCPLEDPCLFESVCTDGFCLQFGTIMTISLKEALAIVMLSPPSPVTKEGDKSYEKTN